MAYPPRKRETMGPPGKRKGTLGEKRFSSAISKERTYRSPKKKKNLAGGAIDWVKKNEGGRWLSLTKNLETHWHEKNPRERKKWGELNLKGKGRALSKGVEQKTESWGGTMAWNKRGLGM